MLKIRRLVLIWFVAIVMIATAIPQAEAAGIEQEALNHLYGSWGTISDTLYETIKRSYTEDQITYFWNDSKKDSYNYEVLEAYYNGNKVLPIVNLKVHYYIYKIKVYAEEPCGYEMLIEKYKNVIGQDVFRLHIIREDEKAITPKGGWAKLG